MQGLVKRKGLLERFIEDKLGDCLSCKANTNIPNPEPVKMSDLPSLPFSRYPMIEVMKNTTRQKVINRLYRIVSLFGYPDSCKHDNDTDLIT